MRHSDYPKQFYKLWWEYLHRSENYRELCEHMRTDKPLPDKFINPNHPQSCTKIVYTYLHNLDIHQLTFEEWYEYKISCFKNNEKAQQKMCIRQYDDYLKEEIDGSICFLKRTLGRDPTIQEFKNFLFDDSQTKFRKNWAFVIEPYRMAKPKVLKIIQDEIAKYRKKVIRYDEIERYLKIFDLKQEGLTIKAIINKIDPNRSGDDDAVIRTFRRDISNAKEIIKNVENGNFPGKYNQRGCIPI